MNSDAPESSASPPWDPWTGGECPLPADTPVTIMTREGRRLVGHTAGFWQRNWPNPDLWRHEGRPEMHIVAYKSEPEPPDVD